MAALVEVEGLVKRYGDLKAVDGLSFQVKRQQIFALVGPNGAGKTTSVECVEGLRRPDAGELKVLGLDPARDHDELYRRLGVQLQENSMYSRIRVGEALRLFASFYDQPIAPRRLLEELDLREKEGTYYAKLSGGQKRKLLTAVALVGNPELVILDEPTSGLDPQSRRDFWTSLRRYRDDGLTILLTTHDMQEAEEHCDRVSIIDRGRVVRTGSPRQLLDSYRLGIRVTASLAGRRFDTRKLEGREGITRVEVVGDQVFAYGTGERLLPEVAGVFQRHGLEDIGSRQAGLEDLYLILTGRDFEQEHHDCEEVA